jgi:hypothetical protein
MFFHRICCYFLWHVNLECASSARRLRRSTSPGARSTLLLDGGALLPPFTLLGIAISQWKKLCNCFWWVQFIIIPTPTKVVSTALTVMSTGTKTRPHPLPIVFLTTRLEKSPPAMFFEPATVSIPIGPHSPYLPLDLARYTSDWSHIRSPYPPGAS